MIKKILIIIYTILLSSTAIGETIAYKLKGDLKFEGSASIEVNATPLVDDKVIEKSKNKKWFVPYVIEPSAGVDRGFLAILNEAYTLEVLADGKERVVLKLRPHLSPIKAAVIPLKKNNEGLVALAKEIKSGLQSLGKGRVILENTGNIGKAYRRHDEVGTPLCITVDFDSLEKNIVTIRNRDTMEQTKMNIDMIEDFFVDYYK